MPTIECHALNISAHPHPPGIYRELFERLASKRAMYYGDKVAAFSVPSEIKDGIFYGLIITWTEIDKNQSIIDTILLDKPTSEKLNQLRIPDNLGFNAQTFYYAFRVADHVLVFESRNSENATLGPINAEKIFRKIFSRDNLQSAQFQRIAPRRVEVDLLIRQDALNQILSIKNLQKLQINIRLENSDDLTEDADDIVGRLKKVRARQQTIIYKSERPDKGIVADQRVRTESEAALRHGDIQGSGSDGQRSVSLNSKSYPQKERAFIDKAASSVNAVVSMAARYFKVAQNEPKAN